MKSKMHAIAISALAAFSTGQALAQEAATTQSGRTVMLNPNGTWTNVPLAPASSGNGSKTPSAVTKLDVGRTGYVFYFDPKKWTRKPTDADGKMTFTNKSGEVYGMIISERIQVDVDNLVKIALQNAQTIAPEAKIVQSGQKVVNGFPVRAATIEGTTQGISFVYHSYYFSGKGGAVQVVTYTGANLFDEYKPEMEEFLNGFVGGT